jgi:hypothetical protein
MRTEAKNKSKGKAAASAATTQESRPWGFDFCDLRFAF